MIVRVLGQGQWVLEVDHLDVLNVIDEDLERAVEANDEAGVQDALVRLFDGVRELGTEVPDDVLAESDLVLPDPGTSIEDVRLLLEASSEFYGLIPDEAAPSEDSAAE